MNAVKTRPSERLRVPLLVLAAARAVVSVAAVPLAPVLYKDHFLVLVLLRPTKEVLLAGGFLVRRGDVHPLPLILAALPLALFGVWHFFVLGRAFQSEIRDGTGMPTWSQRVLPPERIKQLCKVLDKRGRLVIVAGRVAAFPSSMLGAAAGASGMEPRRFLPADALGAALSIAEVVIAGYLLGAAYKQAGPWITGAGLVVLAGLLVFVGRMLRRT
ncbi:MAG TPA: VTT domain-containing protein [Acidimicrobiales bacterium]|nr:VTT domain-containing protein [Acidimicrobiales bacterium]